MAKLADAQVSGSCGRPCRFKSCHPHHLYGVLHKTRQYPVYFLLFWIIILRFSRFLPRLVRVLVRTFLFVKGAESSENRGFCNRILAYCPLDVLRCRKCPLVSSYENFYKIFMCFLDFCVIYAIMYI